jgi:hypothetical protein
MKVPELTSLREESAMSSTHIPCPTQTSRSRLGFHYFPDTLHYRASDLYTWLPELKAMGTGWLTLVAPLQYAIPEPFLHGLQGAGIEPILHFRLPLSHQAHDDTLGLLFRAYAGWGVRYVALFDRPNQRSSWPVSAWAQSDLVERFLDIFLPVANAALEAGLVPIFPPLEPGGDYWDTAFLRAALEGLARRGMDTLLESLHLSAYAWADEHALEWGVGGPERWPGGRPYLPTADQQDQRGFYIFDWYLAEAGAALGSPRPILLLAAGRQLSSSAVSDEIEFKELEHANVNLSIARRFMPGDNAADTSDPVSSLVLACNFWLLAADPNDPLSSQAWFQADGYRLPVVDAFRQLAIGKSVAQTELQPQQPASGPNLQAVPSRSENLHPGMPKSIDHYLLLPMTEWGAAEWHLDAARPYILKHHPTVGYSTEEASLAEHITVVGGEQVFSEEQLNILRQRGCQVTRISGDGTEIATQLAST